MLRRSQHVAGLAVAVAGTSFAAAFGPTTAVVVAYVLGLALGGVLYAQDEGFAAVGPTAGNVLLGFLVGVVASLALGTGLLAWLVNVPVDFAAWRVGLLMWDSWAGIGAAVLSGFFLVGLGGLVR